MEDADINLGYLNGSGSSDGVSEYLASPDSYKRSTRRYSRWSPVEEGVTLAWSNLSVYAKMNKKGTSYKRIINDVSGAIKAGSIVALMGASGAGKSTLMSALSYRNSGLEVDGDILINGRKIGDYLKYMSGYMHQDDLFVTQLTVFEHMNIMAHLKLDRRITEEERTKKIISILRELGLIKCLHSRIGGIDTNKTLSGGEKKRLAFATELLTDPPILFCDEPTTGLDSYSAQKLVKMMNKMCTEGRTTILCTIHQPSMDIFSMFSQLILLADGRIAYMGAATEAINFFQNLGYTCPTTYSPADFFIKTVANTPGYEDSSRQTIKRICDHYAVSDYAKEVNVVLQYEFHMGRSILQKKRVLRENFKDPFWHSKLYWLTKRWFSEVTRNPSIALSRIIQRITIAIIVGLCYLGTNPDTQSGVQSVQGVIFIFVTENTFAPMYSVLAEFPKNSPIFLREYRSGLYHPLTYYLSRIISLLPGFIVEPMLFALIAYWLAGLRQTLEAFFTTIFVLILTTNVASACGIMFSNAFESVPSAMSYLVPFDYLLMITSGIFIKLSTLPTVITWTKYMSWFMYSTETLSILQWEGVQNITCETQLEGIPCLKRGREVLAKYSFSEDNFSRDIFNIFALLTIFYIIGYLCLSWRIRRK